MLNLQFLTCKKYSEHRSTVKNCNFSKLQFFKCTSTVISMHIFAVQSLKSLTQKTKIWCNNAVSRRFGKYSFHHNIYFETLFDYQKPQWDAQCPKDGQEHQVQGSCQSVFQIVAVPKDNTVLCKNPIYSHEIKQLLLSHL